MQRYDFATEWEYVAGRSCVEAIAVPSSIGRWVRFEDAAKLQDRIDDLESELEEIRQQGV